MKTAVVIIPTYNEKDSIERTLLAVLKVFKTISDWRMRVLVVDDTSPDKTYLVVERLAKNHPSVSLLLNKKKSGLGGAYLKGMDHAFNKLNATVVFEFDADLSHPPEKIPAFLKRISDGADMVIGSRYGEGGSIPADWGWHRKFLSVGGNLVIMTLFLNFAIRDWTSGYRAITRPVYQAVHPLLHSEQFYGYTFQIGFLYNAVKAGYRIDQVPYHFVDRLHGQSKIGPEYIKNTLTYIAKVRSKELLENRIFKFAVVGAMGAVVQFISLAWFRASMSFTLAYFLSAQLAVTSNFIFSNLWTFSDRKLTLPQIPVKYVAFSAASFGSVAIQTALAWLGSRFIGDQIPLFTVPFSSMLLGKAFMFDTGFLFMVIGILVGMIWNYTAYSRLIWKNKLPQS